MRIRFESRLTSHGEVVLFPLAVTRKLLILSSPSSHNAVTRGWFYSPYKYVCREMEIGWQSIHRCLTVINCWRGYAKRYVGIKGVTWIRVTLLPMVRISVLFFSFSFFFISIEISFLLYRFYWARNTLIWNISNIRICYSVQCFFKSIRDLFLNGPRYR